MAVISIVAVVVAIFVVEVLYAVKYDGHVLVFSMPYVRIQGCHEFSLEHSRTHDVERSVCKVSDDGGIGQILGHGAVYQHVFIQWSYFLE